MNFFKRVFLIGIVMNFSMTSSYAFINQFQLNRTQSSLNEQTQDIDKQFYVATSEEFQDTCQQIKDDYNQDKFTIVFTNNQIDVKQFAGITSKTVTLKSHDGYHFQILNMGTNLIGNIIFDNVMCYDNYSRIYANGYHFETTENFTASPDYQGQPMIINYLFGGSQNVDSESDTHIVIKGGKFANVYGGGDNANVLNTHVTINGNVFIRNLFGGGLATHTAKGMVLGDTNILILHGENGMLFGGGQNQYTSSADLREPASVKGTVHVQIGYKGAPAGIANVGINMDSFGGSWHSTVGNVKFFLLEGTTTTDRYFYGCGYRDTVQGTVEIHVQDGKIAGGRIYGGGDTDMKMDDSYGSFIILNQNHQTYALKILYDCIQEPLSHNVHHGINAGSSDGFPMEIWGDVLIDVKNGDLDFAVLDNEYVGYCTIYGDAILHVENGRIAQVQGNKKNNSQHQYQNQLIYDGSGQKNLPVQAGYFYMFDQVLLKNNAYVFVASQNFSQLPHAQKPFFTIKDIYITKGCQMITDGNKANVLGNVKLDGIWEQRFVQASDYLDLHIQGQLEISPNGELISLGTAQIDREVKTSGKMALMKPTLFQSCYQSNNTILYLPAISYQPAEQNYPNGDIPLNIKGNSQGMTKLYIVSVDNWSKMQKPRLGDNYIIGIKNQSHEVFQLENQDAKNDEFYLKRIDDVDKNESSIRYMWQIAKHITLTFDENGGDTKAEPRTQQLDYISGKNNYYFHMPIHNPVRKGYTLKEWNTQSDGSGDIFNEESPMKRSLTVYAIWQENQYRIHYNTGFDDLKIKDKTNVKWNQDHLIMSLQRDGYIFEGWYLNHQRVEDYTKYSDLTSLDNDQTSLSFTAQWKPKIYQIHYNTNGGNIIEPSLNIQYTDDHLIPKQIPVKDGYIFLGWEYQNHLVNQNMSYKELAKQDYLMSMTFYAKWQKKVVISFQEDSSHDIQVLHKKISQTNDETLPYLYISLIIVSGISFCFIKRRNHKK